MWEHYAATSEQNVVSHGETLRILYSFLVPLFGIRIVILRTREGIDIKRFYVCLFLPCFNVSSRLFIF